VTDTVLPLAAATAFFSLLHVIALVRVEPVYPRAFKLSRGLAALILTALGVAAFVSALPHWKEAFLYRHADGDWMRIGLLAVCGHLLADFLWMALGRWKYAIRPRKDLILHHGLGVLGFGAALYLRIGYAVALLTMITELLPVTTGLNAWAKRIKRQPLVDAADRARLYLLAGLRLPLWSFLLVLVALALLGGRSGDLQAAYLVALAGLAGLVVLDLYWVRKCRQHVDFY